MSCEGVSDIWGILKYREWYLCHLPWRIHGVRCLWYKAEKLSFCEYARWELLLHLGARIENIAFPLRKRLFVCVCVFFSRFCFQHFLWVLEFHWAQFLAVSATLFENKNTTPSVAIEMKYHSFNQSPSRNFLACIIKIFIERITKSSHHVICCCQLWFA